jgi:pimeloyl-ACP methyl ester carboxylesterase
VPTTSTPHGVVIHYDTFGDPSHPTVLLIQGLGAHMLGWRAELCQQLADAGCHVIRYDNRDVGLSQRFPAGGYTVADMADDAAGLLDALGVPQAHILGQSMGGMIAQHLTVEHPEKVASLVLVYTTPSIHYVATRDLIDNQLELPPPRNRDEAVAHYVDSQVPCASPGFPQDVAWLRELGGLMHDRGDDRDGPRRQMDALLADPDRSSRLAQIAVPTTILHGDADRLIDPSAAEALHRAIPRSTLTVHPGMGHELPGPLWKQIIEQIRTTVAAGQALSMPRRPDRHDSGASAERAGTLLHRSGR